MVRRGFLSDASRRFNEFASSPSPATDEELWRYSPISELDLDKFVPSGSDAVAGLSPVSRLTPGRSQPPLLTR